jgi:phosphopantetheinyl transferase
MLMIVLSVNPEESMLQDVIVQLENSMPVLLNVNHVHIDVTHAKDLLIIVLTVPKTE